MISSVAEAIIQYPTANGLAVVISNDYEHTKVAALKGTHEDAKVMRSTLCELKYAVVTRHNITKRDTLQLIEKMKTSEYPDSYQRIIFVFSGHGTYNDHLQTQDCESVSLPELVEQFLPKNAPNLIKIPKLFFIDACRGSLVDPGVVIPRAGGAKDPTKSSLPRGGNPLKMIKLPSIGNYLLAYSTIPNHKSFELASGGLWMSSLAEKLMTENKSVLDILTQVNQDFIRKHQSTWSSLECVQQPELYSTLNETVNLLNEAQTGQSLYYE